jgi:5-dehydro-4-deoxyglucarate dehydratase
MTFDPDTLRAELGAGLLCFPVTHAREDFGLDEGPYREHVAWQSSFPAAALFAAAGTGEFPALTPPEIAQAVRAAVAASTVPVIAPAGYGTADAVAMACDAEEVGAAGVFLLPTYLAVFPPDALVAHVRDVCAATAIAVIVHDRDDLVARLAGDCPNLVGFPVRADDGLPDVHTRLRSALPATCGQIVNFAPRFAHDLDTAMREGDSVAVYRKVEEFVLPYLEIRDRRPGYGIATLKAALAALGRPAGPVRPPLTDLTPTEVGELKALLDKVDLA